VVLIPLVAEHPMMLHLFVVAYMGQVVSTVVYQQEMGKMVATCELAVLVYLF